MSAAIVDYFSHILGFERFRAGQFGIRHYCCIGLNSKEANNEALAEEVMELLPRFATKEGVVAIGEIGYDEQTGAEDKYFRLQLELARELDLPVMIHTPHRDKKRGTSRSMDVIVEHGLDPARVVIDHDNEETVREVIDRGFWAAFSIYPHSKMGNERMVEIVRAVRPRADDRRLGLRLGHLRSALGAQDRAMLLPSAASPRRRRACHSTPTRSPPTARAGRCRSRIGWSRQRSTSARSIRGIQFYAAARSRVWTETSRRVECGSHAL